MPPLAEDLQNVADAIVHEHAAPIACRTGAHYSVADAVAIYRNNYCGNLQDALAGAYPIVEQIVGEKFFRMMTRHYVNQHPSRSGNLHRYGAGMAAFIAVFPPAQGLPYLSDVADLEWACHCAYFAEDAAALDIVALSQVPEAAYPDLMLGVHPACGIVRSQYPIAAIWRAHQPGAPREFHINLDSGPCIALVSRKDNLVQVSELNEAELAWFDRLRAGLPLGPATDTTLAQFPEFDLQAALVTLVSRNVITGFVLRKVP